jgi:hypothetical protein
MPPTSFPESPADSSDCCSGVGSKKSRGIVDKFYHPRKGCFSDNPVSRTYETDPTALEFQSTVSQFLMVQIQVRQGAGAHVQRELPKNGSCIAVPSDLGVAAIGAKTGTRLNSRIQVRPRFP